MRATVERSSASRQASYAGRLRHWAQVAVGKADAKPALPPPRPGDELEWARDREARRLPAALPVPLDHDPVPTASSSALRRSGEHALLLGARADFQKTRGGSSFWNEYPRPTKHNLADIVVSAEGLAWAVLMKRACAIDVLVCFRCAGS